jgi:hypothetical protein
LTFITGGLCHDHQDNFAAAATIALLSTGAVYAQAPSADKPAAAAATAKPRSAKSLDCSKQADAKGLQGKARKKFRSECRKA